MTVKRCIRYRHHRNYGNLRDGKSTCDEHINQLTLGVGGGSKALQHYHRTKSTLGFIYIFHEVLTDVDFRLFFISRPSILHIEPLDQ